ncbi:pyridoxamine 5'-phosphate oxidase family protein [Nereida ignava]|jgi:pyridoxamine 5'-phosphate oxidase|uniref:pyridoxamine 5'-phosphate oxidase family protein n=1 Tax=Nereida ignava TaxID=282199 RepID=UPI0030F5E26D
MNADRHNWACDLSQLYAEVWASLMRGVHDRHAPARHSTLATVSTDGRPQARTVVLRAANKMAGTLDIHTDLHSAKVRELRVTPFAALHVWDASANLQLRLEAHVTLLTGPDVAAIWESVPAASRLSYGSDPAPGQPIAKALDYTKGADQASFAILRLAVETVDALNLGQQHRRARFNRDDNWAGMWVAP